MYTLMQYLLSISNALCGLWGNVLSMWIFKSEGGDKKSNQYKRKWNAYTNLAGTYKMQ